jgi:hypothetical protein
MMIEHFFIHLRGRNGIETATAFSEAVFAAISKNGCTVRRMIPKLPASTGRLFQTTSTCH